MDPRERQAIIAALVPRAGMIPKWRYPPMTR
jgi:hypothetical protein